MTGVLVRREDTDTQGECHVMTEAEAGVMCLQAKDCEQTEGYVSKEGFVSRAFRGHGPEDSLFLNFWPPEL